MSFSAVAILCTPTYLREGSPFKIYRPVLLEKKVLIELFTLCWLRNLRDNSDMKSIISQVYMK